VPRSEVDIPTAFGPRRYLGGWCSEGQKVSSDRRDPPRDPRDSNVRKTGATQAQKRKAPPLPGGGPALYMGFSGVKAINAARAGTMQRIPGLVYSVPRSKDRNRTLDISTKSRISASKFVDMVRSLVPFKTSLAIRACCRSIRLSPSAMCRRSMAIAASRSHAVISGPPSLHPASRFFTLVAISSRGVRRPAEMLSPLVPTGWFQNPRPRNAEKKSPAEAGLSLHRSVHYGGYPLASLNAMP
jgi:hypothetical protein